MGCAGWSATVPLTSGLSTSCSELLAPLLPDWSGASGQQPQAGSQNAERKKRRECGFGLCQTSGGTRQTASSARFFTQVKTAYVRPIVRDTATTLCGDAPW